MKEKDFFPYEKKKKEKIIGLISIPGTNEVPMSFPLVF